LRERKKKRRRTNNIIMSELLEFVIVSIEIIANAANLLLVAFSRGLPNAQGQVVALFAIAIAAAEVAVGLGLIIVAYRLYKEIDVAELRSMRG
jgi:NADH-quinone oxidoreductase subunit K